MEEGKSIETSLHTDLHTLPHSWLNPTWEPAANHGRGRRANRPIASHPHCAALDCLHTVFSNRTRPDWEKTGTRKIVCHHRAILVTQKAMEGEEKKSMEGGIVGCVCVLWRGKCRQMMWANAAKVTERISGPMLLSRPGIVFLSRSISVQISSLTLLASFKNIIPKSVWTDSVERLYVYTWGFVSIIGSVYRWLERGDICIWGQAVEYILYNRWRWLYCKDAGAISIKALHINEGLELYKCCWIKIIWMSVMCLK